MIREKVSAQIGRQGKAIGGDFGGFPAASRYSGIRTEELFFSRSNRR